jgi:hypothetical protein
MAWWCGDGWDNVADDALDLGGDVGVGLGREPEVVGGVGDRGVAQVGLQDRQQRADVLAAGEPVAQIVDSKGMAFMRNSS